MKIIRLLTAATAAFFIAGTALAQQGGTVTQYAFAIGKGPGSTSFTSLLCGSAQLAVGQSAAAPICRTLTGDVTLTAAGVTAIGANKVLDTMLRQGVARSVIGVTGNATANEADIQGATDQILRVNGAGTALAFGSIDLSKSAAVGSTILPIANGGTNAATAANARTNLGLAIGSNVQAWDTDLDCLAALATNGIVARTGAGTCAVRTITAPAAGITFSNGDGVAGNPTLALANDLAALEALSGTNNIYYRSGVDTWSSVSIGSGLTFTSGTLAASGGGGSASPSPPQGRLTLLSGSPVMTNTQSAKTTFYYTPYVGNQIPIYDGTTMTMTAFPEISVATTDTAKNPAAIGASKVNDWFVWNDAGTLRLTHGPDWTSDTVRSAGTALVMVNGVLLNNASITNGPAASRGTYVGTTVSASDSKLYWLYGTLASGGTAGFLGVWNMYNRVAVSTTVSDSTDTWSLAFGNIRPANNSLGMRVTFVSGMAEDIFFGSYQCTTANTASGQSAVGVMYDNITAFNGRVGASLQASSNGTWSGDYRTTAIGTHYFQAGEASQVSGNQLFYGDGSVPSYLQNGLSFEGRM